MSSITLPAIVPAAGESRRMGRPKPLLPFNGQPLIGRVVTALRIGGASPVLVVTPPAQAPEGPPIAEAARQAGAVVITPPQRPAEMRESAEIAIAQLGRDGPPAGFVLTPGDSAGITPEIVRQVLERSASARLDGHPARAGLPHSPDRPALGSRSPDRDIAPASGNQRFDDGPPRPRRRDRSPSPRAGRRAQYARGPRALAAATQNSADHPPLCRCQGACRTCRDRHRSGLTGDRRRSPPGARPATPRARALAPSVAVAVDSEYATDVTLILPGAQVALIPPVSGG